MTIRIQVELPDEVASELAEAIARELAPLLADARRLDGFTTGDELGISRRTVQRLVREGKLQGYHPGRDLVVERDALVRYVKSCAVDSRPTEGMLEARVLECPDVDEAIESALAEGKLHVVPTRKQ